MAVTASVQAVSTTTSTHLATEDGERGRSKEQSASASTAPSSSIAITGSSRSSANAAGSTTNATRSPSSTRELTTPGGEKRAATATTTASSSKAGSCTAGASCSFSHEVVAPGTAKPVCKFFTQGNCKFAHKCALAHILPGQPMSFDRKNKRAAQAALREAQQQVAQGASGAGREDLNSGPLANTNSTTAGAEPSSGLAKSLQASMNTSANLNDEDPSNGSATWSKIASGGAIDPTSPSRDSSSTATAIESTSPGSQWPPESEEGMSPRISRTKPFASPPNTSPSMTHLSPPGSTASFLTSSAPSGLSQTFNNINNTSAARSSVAAQVMLGQQARRMSSNGGDTLSPPPNRLALGSSPPLAMGPSTSLTMAGASASGGGTNGNGSTSIFGTSPFSGGSRALFMPSSYDSNEDGFPRSPPAKGSFLMSDQMKRSSSSGWARPGGILFGGESAVEENGDGKEKDDGDDEEDDAFNSEGFLPSSLNDLLTPEEVKRRASRTGGMGFPSPTAFNPFSRSVPPDMMLARPRPSMPVHPMLSSSSTSSMNGGSGGGWGTLSASAEGTNPTASSFSPSKLGGSTIALPPPSRSLLSASLAPHNSLAVGSPSSPSNHLLSNPSNRSMYSSTFDPPTSNFGHRPSLGGSTTNQRSAFDLSPSFNPVPAPSSLPGGLAAGLSQLHLIPPLHTGDTPPASLSKSNSIVGSPWNRSSSNDEDHVAASGSHNANSATIGSNAISSSSLGKGAWLSAGGVEATTPGAGGGVPTVRPAKTWASIASSPSTSQAQHLRPPTSTSGKPKPSTNAAALNSTITTAAASPLSKPTEVDDHLEGSTGDEDEMQFSMDA